MTSPADLPARELDARVARDVMGWTGIPAKAFDRKLGGEARASWTESHDAPWHGIDPRGKSRKIPRYSTDMRAMGTVLDALRERGWKPDLRWFDDEDGSGWMAIFWPGEKHDKAGSASTATLPRAVALAALAAVGGK